MKTRPDRTHTLARRLFALQEPQIFYLFIPKCGCTFVKNVLWAVKNGEYHPQPLRIHDHDSAFPRASDTGFDVGKIYLQPLAFTVIRNPIDRLLSLYFDKVIGPGRRNYIPLAKVLTEKRGLNADPASITEHHRNIEILVEWLIENLSDAVDLPKDAHWTPQVHRSDVMQTFNLKMLVVDRLSLGLELLLSPAVRNIRAIIEGAERNSSRKSLEKRQILTHTLRQKINHLYARDRQLYHLVNNAWENKALSVASSSAIPRYLDLVKS